MPKHFKWCLLGGDTSKEYILHFDTLGPKTYDEIVDWHDRNLTIEEIRLARWLLEERGLLLLRKPDDPTYTENTLYVGGLMYALQVRICKIVTNHWYV